MLACPAFAKRLISIHALRKESDLRSDASGQTILISIHALRKESDYLLTGSTTRGFYFNPRSP